MMLNSFVRRLASALAFTIAAVTPAIGAPLEPVWSLVQKEKPRLLDTLDRKSVV